MSSLTHQPAEGGDSQTRWLDPVPGDLNDDEVGQDHVINRTRQLNDENHVEIINYVAHGIIANIIVGVGIVGNLLNLIVLTRPKLKGVMYVYLLGLAVSNLCVLLTAIPALMVSKEMIHLIQS